MSSQIETVFDELAATSITVNSETISVKDADELPNSVPSANLPVRLLTVVNTNGSELNSRSDTIGHRGYSQPMVVFWQVSDVLLWAKIGTDIGVKAHSKKLVAYMAQYIEMLRDLDLSGSASVVGWDAVAQPFNYPSGSDDWFYAVVCTLEIKEDVS